MENLDYDSDFEFLTNEYPPIMRTNLTTSHSLKFELLNLILYQLGPSRVIHAYLSQEWAKFVLWESSLKYPFEDNC